MKNKFYYSALPFLLLTTFLFGQTDDLFFLSVNGSNRFKIREPGDIEEWDTNSDVFSPGQVEQTDNLVVGDFNGDGKDDLFFSRYNGTHQFRLQEDNGMFDEDPIDDAFDPQSINAFDHLVVGDFNNDGMDDLFFLSVNGSNRFKIREPGDIEQWDTNSDVFSPGQVEQTDNLVVGDFNGDGKDDLFFSRYNGTHQFRLQEDNGMFDEDPIDDAFDPQSINAFDHLVVGDFNNDGMDDLFFLSVNGSNRFKIREPGDIEEWDTNSDVFSSGQVEQTDNIVVGDFNGDGKDDLFFLRYNGTHQFRLQEDNGMFDEDPIDDAFDPQSINAFDHLVVGDFNNDGPVGFAELSNENNFNFELFPNPAIDWVNLKLNFDFNSDITVSLLDITGNSRVEFKLSGTSTSQIIPIQTNNLSDGIYFIKIQSEKGIRSKKVTILNK